MRAARYDIIIEQGASFEVTFKWTNKAGTAVNLTDLDFEMDIRPTIDSSTVILTGSYEGSTNTPSGNIVFSEGGALGTFGLQISRAVTAALDFTTAVYDVEISNVLNTFRVLYGNVFLAKEVTR